MLEAAPTFRTQRISELVRRELVLLFANKIKDERLSGVRITEVIVSKDLGSAKVFYGFDGDKKPLKESFKKAKGFMRSHLAKTLELRHTPELNFVYDATSKTASRIDELLANI